jgi:hypothetical protein
MARIRITAGGMPFSADTHTVVEGRERLRALGEKVLWQGAQDILFELE